MKSHIILAALWICWCVIHSAMITPAVMCRLERRPGRGIRFYRLLYNIVALLTLVAIAWYERSLESRVVWSWEGFFVYAQASLLAAALILFITGARHYDLRRFLGLRQLGGDAAGKGLTESGDEYREYQKRVPMFLPIGFLTSRRKG